MAPSRKRVEREREGGKNRLKYIKKGIKECADTLKSFKDVWLYQRMSTLKYEATRVTRDGQQRLEVARVTAGFWRDVGIKGKALGGTWVRLRRCDKNKKKSIILITAE